MAPRGRMAAILGLAAVGLTRAASDGPRTVKHMPHAASNIRNRRKMARKSRRFNIRSGAI